MADGWWSSTADNLKGEREASRQIDFSHSGVYQRSLVDRVWTELSTQRTFLRARSRETSRHQQLRRRLQSKPKPATSRYKEFVSLCLHFRSLAKFSRTKISFVCIQYPPFSGTLEWHWTWAGIFVYSCTCFELELSVPKQIRASLVLLRGKESISFHGKLSFSVNSR